MEKSSIEILSQYAKNKNFEYWTDISIKRFYINPSDSYANSKFFVMEIPSDAHTYYYCASDSFAAKAQTSSSYSGIYRDFSNLICPSLKLRRRYWIDNLSFSKRIKLGNPEFDKNILIQCHDEDFAHHVVNSKVGNELVRFNDCISPFEIIVEPNYISYNPKFDGKSILGLETNSWIVNDDEINLLLDKGINLLDQIKNKRQ